MTPMQQRALDRLQPELAEEQRKLRTLKYTRRKLEGEEEVITQRIRFLEAQIKIMRPE